MLLITYSGKKYFLDVDMFLYPFLKSLGVKSLSDVALEKVELVKPNFQEKLESCAFTSKLYHQLPKFSIQDYLTGVLKEKGHEVRKQYYSGDYYTQGWTEWFLNGKLENSVCSFEDLFTLLKISYPYEEIDHLKTKNKMFCEKVEKEYVEKWLNEETHV